MFTRTEDLIAHPQRHFAQPRDVLHDPQLSAEEKLKVLESWKLDASRMAESTAENMSGGEEEDLREVSKALVELKKTAPDVSKPRESRPRPARPQRSSMTGSLAIGAMLGAGAGLVAIAITGPSLAIVAQTTIVGLILGGVVAAVRSPAV